MRLTKWLCCFRKGQHAINVGPLRLFGVAAEFQVADQPQVQRVSGQHQHRAQPRALAQLGHTTREPLLAPSISSLSPWTNRQRLHECTAGILVVIIFASFGLFSHPPAAILLSLGHHNNTNQMSILSNQNKQAALDVTQHLLFRPTSFFVRFKPEIIVIITIVLCCNKLAFYMIA